MSDAARVAIIGGGYAGLAAAVTLADKRIPLTLFESAAECGGRARRVPVHGLDLDNGQHILLGAYRELPRLMKLVSTPSGDLLRFPLRLFFPGKFSITARPFPAPGNVGVGVALAKGVSLWDRIQTLIFMHRLRRENFCLQEDVSVAQWLTLNKQSSRMRDFLWHPLCYAALNTPPAIASARTFLNVLAQSFKHSGDSDMVLPRVDLTHLFPTHALRYILKNNGCIQNSTAVKSIALNGTAFTVETANTSETFSHVICATAPWHVARLLTGLSSLTPLAEELKAVPDQPIYTIYLQYPKFVTLPHPMIGMTGGLAQWLFDRGRLQQHAGLLAAVISAEGPHQALTHADLALRIHEEIHSIFGFPDPLWHQVIAEKRATFACTLGFAAPPAKTPLKNFFLAGDYLEANWPATLETAARSGVRSAHLVMENI